MYLFPQLLEIVDRYVREFVRPVAPAERIDIAVSPYYGWVIERLLEAIKPDASAGEAPELPAIEANRPPGTTGDVDFWTSRDVRPDHQEPRQLRCCRYQTMGAIGSVLHRHSRCC